jgi:glycerophosphoryl diester phosphodiesterase
LAYVKAAKAVGLDIIAWTFERSGPLTGVVADNDLHYTSIASGAHYDGRLYEILDVLERKIGIEAIFHRPGVDSPILRESLRLHGP